MVVSVPCCFFEFVVELFVLVFIDFGSFPAWFLIAQSRLPQVVRELFPRTLVALYMCVYFRFLPILL